MNINNNPFNRFYFTLLFCLIAYLPSFGQQTNSPGDSLAVKEKKWDVYADLLNRYIWRGQSYGGDYVTLQAGADYRITSKITAGVWATTNFRKDYFYPDGTYYKGYNEFDITLSYQLNDYLSFQLADYYWPTLEKVEGVDNNFFNYGKDGTKTIDATWLFDFSEGYKYPFRGTISTLILGNDFRYDGNGNNPKQNFTTYLELGYAFQEVFQGIEIAPAVGAVLNNQAEYYSAADYNKVSFINLSVDASREFDLGNGVTLPLSLSYIHNPATRNTEIFGRNFFVCSIGFYYE
jgi:hypothetical protein